MKKTMKKALAMSCIALAGVGLVGGGAFMHAQFSEPKIELQEKLIYEDKLVEVPVEVKVPFEVRVDNENLGSVMSWVQEEYDEDIDVDYILFEVDSKMRAEAWIRSELVKFLHDEDFFDDDEPFENYRKSEVSVKKIYDAEIIGRDFEDQDLELSYEVKLRAKESGEDREYFRFNVSIPFEGGEMDSEDIEVEYLE